jgi:hypothetical protein
MIVILILFSVRVLTWASGGTHKVEILNLRAVSPPGGSGQSSLRGGRGGEGGQQHHQNPPPAAAARPAHKF